VQSSAHRIPLDVPFEGTIGVGPGYPEVGEEEIVALLAQLIREGSRTLKRTRAPMRSADSKAKLVSA
jgi:hypothetical protein